MQATSRRVRQQLDIRHFAGSAAFVLTVTVLGTSLSMHTRARTRTTSKASARDSPPPSQVHGLAGSANEHPQPSHAARAVPLPARTAASASDVKRASARPEASNAKRTAASAPVPEVSAAPSVEWTTGARELLDRHLSPYGVEHAGASLHSTCVAAYGMWSEGAAPTCQLPGGRRFRFALSSGRVDSITLEQVGLAPVPLLQQQTIEALNNLTKVSDGALVVDASARRLSVSVKTSNY